MGGLCSPRWKPGSSIVDNVKVTGFCPGQHQRQPQAHLPVHASRALPLPRVSCYHISDCFTVMGYEGYSEPYCQEKESWRPDVISTLPDVVGALGSPGTALLLLKSGTHLAFFVTRTHAFQCWDAGVCPYTLAKTLLFSVFTMCHPCRGQQMPRNWS